VRLARQHLGSGPVMVTYGDGVGLVDTMPFCFHRRRASWPPSRVQPRADSESSSLTATGWPRVRGEAANKCRHHQRGFMVFEREAIDRYFHLASTGMLEKEPLNGWPPTGSSPLRASGFWQCVDTLASACCSAISGIVAGPWQTWSDARRSAEALLHWTVRDADHLPKVVTRPAGRGTRPRTRSENG